IHAWVALIDNVHDDSTPESELVGRTPLARLVDVLPGTFYAVNREGRFILWNRNHERLTGLTPEETAATSALELFDLDTRPLIAEKIRRVFENNEEVLVEADVISRSGRETPMLLCGSRIACNGGEYLFGMGLDLTERRRQERTL